MSLLKCPQCNNTLQLLVTEAFGKTEIWFECTGCYAEIDIVEIEGLNLPLEIYYPCSENGKEK